MIAATTKPFAAPPNRRTHCLARIIDLYERNYRLLQRLTPELNYPFDAAVSRVGSEPPLYLVVVKRSRYTVELRLHYRFAGEHGDARPDMRLRVCRDAGTVEALGDPPRQCWPFVDAEVQDAGHFLFQQWRRNHFLARWLEYLVDCGHGFALADRPRETVEETHD